LAAAEYEMRFASSMPPRPDDRCANLSHGQGGHDDPISLDAIRRADSCIEVE